MRLCHSIVIARTEHSQLQRRFTFEPKIAVTDHAESVQNLNMPRLARDRGIALRTTPHPKRAGEPIARYGVIGMFGRV
jgi:hypothetical protein